MSYTVSENSVITSIFVPSNAIFLSCGGTNIAPKSGAWTNFTVGTSNFRYIFNSVLKKCLLCNSSNRS